MLTIKEDYDDKGVFFLGQIMSVIVLMRTDAAITQVFLSRRLSSIALFIRLTVPFSV